MIVIEGTDNSGKSTLAISLARVLGLNIQESEGPPKAPGEMDERVGRYMRLEKTLFVRHPCISQPLYASIRDAARDVIDPILVKEFYAKRPFFVYCDPGNRGLRGHVEKEGEDPDHLEAVAVNYHRLLQSYREWALREAHVVYRIGDDVNRVAKLCLTAV